MGTPENKLSDLVDIVKSWSWIPRRGDTAYLSRDFWMPDQSCRVCYECDSQFTVFNRRHHCRLCGRVFCAKCTANSVPAPSDEPKVVREDWERIRVCNFCFKQWEQRIATVVSRVIDPTPGLSPSPSALSLASAKSGCTCNSSSSSSSVGSIPYSTGPYHHVNYNSGNNSHMPAQMDTPLVEKTIDASESSTNLSAAGLDSSSNHFGFCANRSDDEDDDYGVYRTDSEARPYPQDEDYYGAINIDEIEKIYGSDKVHLEAENLDVQGVDGATKLEVVGESDNIDICSASGFDVEGADAEPVDFENNGLLWLPPEPENEEDEKEVALFEDDEEEGATGEWGYLQSSNSFGSGEYRSRDKSSEEHKRAMKNVVEGHFRALIAQLLQVENLSVSDEDSGENWLDIVTSLSWEAATHLKPDTSKGGGMDPGGYVKVKCIACGRRSESVVIKGVVCKKNVAHRRMTSKIDKPRFLALGGALEYQRVANHLSSFDTLLQQEMDHLKMAVAKIDAHHPNVLLVEKSVSRHAQEFLLSKDISLVLNIKRPLLERIVRCTGAQIVPSIDNLTSPKLGHCEMFHVEKFLEEHGSAGQGGKKLTKTLMFFEGCPKPHGCTILLKGANGDDLKKVKHVVQYGVFAAYHLALETSFLADERASLPELPLKSPITVALPDKPSSIDRSISTIPGFNTPPAGHSVTYQPSKEVEKSSKDDLNRASSTEFNADGEWTVQRSESNPSSRAMTGFSVFRLSPQMHNSQVKPKTLSEMHSSAMDNEMNSEEAFQENTSFTGELMIDGMLTSNFQSERAILGNVSEHLEADVFKENKKEILELSFSKQDVNNNNEEAGCAKEEFPPSPSDHQSILVSLSTRCVWKGTVCERAHLFRIKYYGSFDKPLGRFLRDHLFDQGFRCHSCDMPSEAHVHCYTHRQGSLTISVKKLPDFHLPGEREGKVWMWHRCLRCPRNNGFPPATRRVVMSDAAWGLSFGKFLELSFSNHAAASRVASCGHSLHRDCLRFYGFGRMVACFRYASIDVLSVYLPPSKLEFNYDTQEWIQREAKEVSKRAELLYDEVFDALRKMYGKLESSGLSDDDMKICQHRAQFEELEGLLQKDKDEVQGSLKKVLSKDVKVGQPSVDILELNKLRRQILFLSYIWDQRLENASGLANNNLAESKSNSLPKPGLKPTNSVEKLGEMNRSPRPVKSTSNVDSVLVEAKPDVNRRFNLSQGATSNVDSVLVEAKPDVKLSQGATFTEMSKPMDPKDMPVQPESNNGTEIESSVNTTRKQDLGEPVNMRRINSEGDFPVMESLSDTLEAAWTGESHPASIKTKENGYPFPDSTSADQFTTVKALVTSDVDIQSAEQTSLEVARSLPSGMSIKGPDYTEKPAHWTSLPSLSFQGSLNNNSVFNSQKLMLNESNPVYVPSFREMERKSGARLLLPVGINDTVVSVYDDEPTSIIAYALVSPDYHTQISESDRAKDVSDASVSLPLIDSVVFLSMNSFEDASSDTYRSFGSGDESMLSLPGSRVSQNADPLPYSKDLHARVSFSDDGPLGKVKYTVTCYYAKRFEALRRTCCPSELDFIRSLSRCKKWGAQGGKSNVFFAKTLDDRFIIKQVTKTELESFIKFGPEYFKYLSESIGTGSPTCLAKILGIYQVSAKHVKGGKESKMDVLVMENLLFKRNVTRLYDLKGSSRSRYNPDTSGNNKVLLDQNLIEAMPTSPIFVGSKAKRLLERAVWNDTNFLALIDVMDYSLLVGVDEEKHELVLGIIDFMRQYTWDKHLETWVKTSGILGGPRNTSPTVISPQQYKKRFRKAMTAYFLMMPDQWSPPMVPCKSQTDLCEENPNAGTPQE